MKLVIDMKKAPGLLGVAVLLVSPMVAGAQNPPGVTTQVVRISDLITSSGVLEVLQDSDSSTPTKGEEEGDEKKKGPSDLEKSFKKLKFNRRQSAVLKAWSDPVPEAPEKSTELQEAEETLAKADAELARLAGELEAQQTQLEVLQAAEKAQKAAAEAEQAESEVAKEDAQPETVAEEDAQQESVTEDAPPGEEAAEEQGSQGEGSPQESEGPVTEVSAEAEAVPDESEAAPADQPENPQGSVEVKKLVKKLSKEHKDAVKAQEKATKELGKLVEAHEKALLDHQLVLFQRDVCLGNWDSIHTYLTGLDEADAKAGYAHILVSLVEGPGRVSGQFSSYGEMNRFTPDYLRGMCVAAPFGFEVADLDKIGALLQQAVSSGSLIELCVASLRGLTEGEEPTIQPVEMARVLATAGFPGEAGEFLPAPDQAVADNDRKALNLLSRHFLAKYKKEEKGEYLEQAWTVIQAALADGEIEEKDKEEALKRAVEVAPQITDELGHAWLQESFTDRPERGMEILRVIGESASKALMEQAKLVDERFKSIQLQTTAAEALLDAAPALASDWSDTLDMLASNWLKEAQHSYKYDTSTSRSPRVNRDVYGNMFYGSYNMSRNRNIPDPIATTKLLEIRPSESWLGHVSEGLRPKYAMVLAQLLLKIGDEAEAFPFIERMADSLPERAKDLAEEFLTVWTKNHDPNTNQNNTNQYMFFYGFEQRANAIPLTRSKQLRNLTELADWVSRIRALPIEKVDEGLITRAFTASHSVAEVYRIEDIERIYGEVGGLEPETLAALIQRMRSNLVGVWRDPSVQQDKKTKRRQQDIQAEVLRGYEVAKTVAITAMGRHPGEWSLALAHASVLHDENNFKHEISKSSDFSLRRQEAFDGFERAADLYIDKVDELELDDESADVFLIWFYASLGACDLNALRSEMVLAESEIDLIREAILDLPEEAAKRHMDKFAAQLFSRMSNVSPAVKFRYAGAGLNIVDDNELAIDAREVYEYYRDLTGEIRLQARVDGDVRVAHGVPFGVQVDLRHTREIEREAGGFSKYLTNQNKQVNPWNYGRPTEDYRDKFEETTRKALSENFKVHSVTFNHPDAHSQAEAEYGWRVTPYAYILLESRGPEIDTLPSLRLDLDFLDTSGYAVLPIESSPLLIDSKGTEAPVRPYSDLRLTQTLDERQAKDGKLVLEIVANAKGLVPELEHIADVGSAGFEVASIDDHEVSVVEFDEEGGGRNVLTERTWMITMEAAQDLTELPKAFTFPAADGVESEFQRFVDADLASVGQVVLLEESYGETESRWPWFLGLGLVAVLAVGCLWRLLRKGMGAARIKEERFQLPETLTPFTVIGLLNDMDRAGAIRREQRDDLLKDIRQLEGHYFGNNGHGGEPDLPGLARRWLQRVP